MNRRLFVTTYMMYYFVYKRFLGYLPYKILSSYYYGCLIFKVDIQDSVYRY